MIPIDIGTIEEREELEKTHYESLKGYVARKLLDERSALYSISDPDAKAYIRIVRQAGFGNCLTMSVDNMRKLVESVDKYLPKGKFYLKKAKKRTPKENDFIKTNRILAKIFNYDRFSKTSKDWDLGKLALKLSRYVRVCPYCNAETVYAYKVHAEKESTKYPIKKSSFDHYFPKARYPFLAISLYNLIPSCTRCNTGFKGDCVEHLLDMSHPYVKEESIDKGMKFRITFKKFSGLPICQADDVDKIVLSERNGEANFTKGRTWEKTFRLSDTYTALFKEDACDALNKVFLYRPSYVKFLLQKLGDNGIAMSRGQLERLLYGSEIDRSKINVTRMGKLINDIHETFCAEQTKGVID